MKVTYSKAAITVIVTHLDMESCDYVIIGDKAGVSESELLTMADMLTPEGWAVA